MAIELSIVTPERSVVECIAESVLAPGSEGEFGVLPAHEPVLAHLKAGRIRYEQAGQLHEVDVSGGFVEVTGERVTVLANAVEPVDA